MLGHDIGFILFGLLIAVAGVVAAVFHYRRWRTAYDQLPRAESKPEMLFEVNKNRRRIQIALLGAIGGVMLSVSGLLLDAYPVVGMGLVAGAVLIITWALMLAMADALAIHHHFRSKRDRMMIEHAKLHAEIQQTLSDMASNNSNCSSENDPPD